MEKRKVRQGDRISLILPIQVSGTNVLGDVFLCEGETELVSQNGAKILLPQKLSPDQEITVRCLETGKEAPARVIGRINGQPKQNAYGISLLEPEAAFWGIEFPPRGDSAGAVGRTVLECLACHTRELAYLDGFELEVLEANGDLSRYCKPCRNSTIWKKSFDTISTTPAPLGTQESADERRHEPRRDIRALACVKSREFGEDLVRARNVSRSGLCFESRRMYEKDWEVQVAIPYAAGGGNIFLPARIVRVQPVSRASLNICGVMYFRKQGR